MNDVTIQEMDIGEIDTADTGMWKLEGNNTIVPIGNKKIPADSITGLANIPTIKKTILLSIEGELSTDVLANVAIPFDITIEEIYCYVLTAPTDSDLILDINRGVYNSSTKVFDFTTIFTTQANRPLIPIGETKIMANEPDITDIYQGNILQVVIDQIGSAKELLISIICRTTDGNDLE